MKKIYLTCLTFVMLVALSGVANAQVNTYVTGPAKVKVEDGTLFYHGGDLVLTEGAVAPADQEDKAVVENAGNVKVKGAFLNDSDGTNFVSTYDNTINPDTDGYKYGQVWVTSDNGGLSTGKMTMEKLALASGKTKFGQFAIPYKFTSAAEAMKTLFGIEDTDFGCAIGVDCGVSGGKESRFLQPLFAWSNDMYRTDHLGGSDIPDMGDGLFAFNYYMLNMYGGGYYQSLIDFMDANAGDNRKYSGIVNDVHVRVPISAENHPYTAEESFDAWRSKRTVYFERYYGFITDDFEDYASSAEMLASTTYGKYIFQFGNPYTTNLNLVNLPNALDDKTNFSGVALYYENESYNLEDQDIQQSGSRFFKATYENDVWTGDGNALLVRPFQPFIIKFSEDPGNNGLNFSDDLKTFAQNWEDLGETVKTDNPALQRSITSMSLGNGDFHQLGLELYQEDGKTPTANARLYVVVSDQAVAGERKEFEAGYPEFDNEATGFYSLQETAEGGMQASGKMYINGVDDEYIAKPIYLQFNDVDNSSYILKASLFEGSIFNKLEEGNFSDGGKFIFVEKDEEGKIISKEEITAEFEKEIKSGIDKEADRYVVYWREVPMEDDGLDIEEIVTNSQTVVYAEGDYHKVRFSNEWKYADIYIYDLSGRLISSEKQVPTHTDHLLRMPNNNSSIYVVKLISDNGEIVTKKVIKK